MDQTVNLTSPTSVVRIHLCPPMESLMITDISRINSILDRGIVKQILPSREEFVRALISGKQLKFYIGADPTGNALHLSHAKNFMLLEEFRQLGHKVYVLFGDFTACIGDPSDRTSARTTLTREQARVNAQNWVNQIKRIINFDDPINPAEVVFNSTWHDKFSPADLMGLFSNASVQRMIERDMFQKRLAENRPIFLNEFLYPMFQGYDSVALDVDVELCGTDQIFNALTGRDLVRRYRGKDKYVVAVGLMENPITGELMSKSNNTGVFLGTDASTMFGQIMALPDEMIEVILINDTRVTLEEIKTLDITNKPMEAKLFAAREVTRIFYGEEADSAYEKFVETFRNRSFPADAPVVLMDCDECSLIDLISKCLTSKSKSEIRRLISQSAVTINGEKCGDDKVLVLIPSKDFLEVKIGKKNFFKVKRARVL